MKRICRSSSRWRSLSSGAMTTNFARSNAMCRSMSGKVPLPMEPKPIITIGPSKRAWSGPLSAAAMLALILVTPCSAAVRSDVVGLQRREAVERHRGVGRGVGAGTLDQHLVADLEADRQGIGLSFVHDVGRVAGRSRDHAGSEFVAVTRGTDRIPDRFVHGLGKTAELADIEIDPAHVVVLVLLGDEHDLGFDHAGIADHTAARFDDRLRNAVAEVPAQRAEDGRTVGLHRRHVLEVAGWESAAQINHGEIDAALAAFAEDRGDRSERAVPGMRVALLRADMEGDAASDQPEAVGMLQYVGRHGRLAAAFAR